MAWRRGPPPQISPPSVQRQGCRTPKLKFLLTFDRNLEYKRPAGAYPLRNFHKICIICIPFQDPLAVKISLDLLKGLWSYGVLSSGNLVTPKFSAPLAAKLCARPTIVFEVQERARGPLSLCQVWWVRFHPPPGWPKTLSFFVCLSVCLSVTVLNVSVVRPIST